MDISFSKGVAPALLPKLKEHVYDIIGCCQRVHKEMGPWLNEYIYQDSLQYAFEEAGVAYEREYYFSVCYHKRPLSHRHFVDFKCGVDVFVECKAIQCIGPEQRQQLWNYLRLTDTPIGILYNFAPVKDQCEKYFYDAKSRTLSAF